MGNGAPRLSKTLAALINSLSAITFLSLGSSAGRAAGDRAAGQQFFTACHAKEAGVNKIGPSLAGVFGRKSGSALGYNYSPALKAQTSRGTRRHWIDDSRTQLPTFTARKCSSPFLMSQIARMSFRISRL
jgi:cytochrome c2